MNQDYYPPGAFAAMLRIEARAEFVENAREDFIERYVPEVMDCIEADSLMQDNSDPLQTVLEHLSEYEVKCLIRSVVIAKRGTIAVAAKAIDDAAEIVLQASEAAAKCAADYALETGQFDELA